MSGDMTITGTASPEATLLPASSPRTLMEPSVEPLDLRYPGGKGLSGLHQWICEQIPTHVYYAEPFAGHGGIFRNKVPALRTWLIDADSDVVTWWHRHQQRSRPQPSVSASCFHRRPQRGYLEVFQGCGIRWTEIAAEWQIPILLLYLDPPYLPETRVRQNLYRFEMSVDDHRRMLHAAVNCRGPVMISGYRSELYFDVLAGWTVSTRWVITRGGTLREEYLWFNQACSRASSALSMEYSELGSSFRERERIDRKRRRWTENYSALPERERRAILLDLLDAERSSSKRKP